MVFAMSLSIKARIYAGFAIVLIILAGASTSSVLVNRYTNTQLATLLAAFDRKSEAVNMALVTERTRVHVNQWLRSFNPDFAKQADQDLVDHAALITKAEPVAQPGLELDTIRAVKTSAQNYTVSWHIVQDLYAKEAKITSDEIDANTPKIRSDLGSVRDLEAIKGSSEAYRTAIHARDELTTAANLALRYRTSSKSDDAAKVFEALSHSQEAIDDLGRLITDKEEVTIVKRASASLAAWRSGFEALKQVIETRAARLVSWTRDEGTPMAKGANTLAAEAEKAVAAAQSALLDANALSERLLYASTIISILCGLCVAYVIARSIIRPIAGMTAAMNQLATGDTNIIVPSKADKNEIGQMANAVDVFRLNAIARTELEESQVAEQSARQRRADMVDSLVRDFEQKIGTSLTVVTTAASQLDTTALSMSKVAENTNHQAVASSAAAEQTSANVQTVASSAVEMASSLREIERQVVRSNDVANNATRDAESTNSAMLNLSEAAEKIGAAVTLISGIAGQTNLLALNATIEAARAGEAGRGFAVVASEVKQLAGQTAKATGEISGQIAAIQAASNQALSAIRQISQTIVSVNEITSMIAETVVQQTAATDEISRNAGEAAKGTQDVSVNISGVLASSEQTGTAASQVRVAASELSAQSRTVKQEVDSFLAAIRAA
jgi:methyl-accepting chemotaxis protein